MKVAIIHGYLLSGTGSNIYVANLVAGLVDRGHQVFIFCQETEPQNFDFFDECYDFCTDNERFFPVWRQKGRGPGRALLFRPRIGKLLPVYVLDDYVGHTAREFHRLAKNKIQEYVERTTQAVKTIHNAFGFDVVQANHLIASPAVARHAVTAVNIPYHVTIHGSSLNYSVKHSSTLVPLALFGLEKAASVSASSEFLGGQLNEFLASCGHPSIKVNTIYPGVEFSAFKPAKDKNKQIVTLNKELEKRHAIGKSAGLKNALRSVIAAGDPFLIEKELSTPIIYDRRAPDSDLADTLRSIDWQRERIALFVGKYLVGKGLHALILAAPIILLKEAEMRLMAVGFSGQRELFEALLTALATGRGDIVQDILDQIEKPAELSVGQAFIADLKKRGQFKNYLETAKNMNLLENFIFTGPLNHFELGQLLATADLMISPSIFPEAFGMVGVEALACGVYPILTDAFGMAEIIKIIKKHIKNYLEDQPPLMINADFINALADNVLAYLRRSVLENQLFKNKAHKLAVDQFNWNRVVDKYLTLFTETIAKTHRA